LRSQLLYSLGHPLFIPHDARLFSELSGAVEPILLDWCNKMHHINTDGFVGKFLKLEIKLIEQMWDNVVFEIEDGHIKENTHIAHVFPNIKNKQFSVLYCHGIKMVQPDTFMGNNQLILSASSAIHQIDYSTPEPRSRFHTLDCGFMNHMYYHTSNATNVYTYNNV
jgi:hypothetical protein